MKFLFTIFTITLWSSFSPVTTVNLSDNYKIIKTKQTSSGASYEVKCIDCGKYVTIYYKKSSKRYAQGDSPWYTQYKSLDKAATAVCDDKCD